MNPRVTIALALATLFVFAGIVFLARPGGSASSSTGDQERFDGASLPKGLKAPDFALRDQDGKRVSMREYRGKPVIVSFLYSTCRDTCPLQAQQIKGALNELGTDVPALAVSVDPANDTPLNAKRFNTKQQMVGRMRWVLGSRKELGDVWRPFAATGQRSDVEHNARFVLVDPKGFQRVGFPVDQVTPERVAHDVRLLEAGR